MTRGMHGRDESLLQKESAHVHETSTQQSNRDERSAEPGEIWSWHVGGLALIHGHRRRLVLVAATLLVTAGLAIVVAADARARLPRGVEIAGVAVGGVSAGEAERLVSARAEELAVQSTPRRRP